MASEPDTESEQSEQAVAQLAAMAHSGRLALLKLLIQAGPGGLAAGAIARAAGIAPPTATGQLAALRDSGLLWAQRQGRQIIYRANYTALTGLLQFLMADCCCGRDEICAPLGANVSGATA
ncbi:MAG: helix-turn-helix transcriptional regulator [Pseudomonadota bacterium]